MTGSFRYSDPMTEEVWLPVLGGFYAVTRTGRVRRVRGGQGARLKELTRFIATTGYVVVNICIFGQKATVHVHALVAEAFIGPRPPKFEIDHINGDRGDCRVENLEYVTRSENMQRWRRLKGRTKKKAK